VEKMAYIWHTWLTYKRHIALSINYRYGVHGQYKLNICVRIFAIRV